MNANDTIQQLIDKTNEVAIDEVVRLAKKILKKHKNLDRFCMGMGSYCFFNDKNQVINLDQCQYMSELYDFIENWDMTLTLSGNNVSVRQTE